MHIRIAAPAEFQAVRSFYHKVIDGMRGAEYKPAWEKGIYPSDRYLKDSVERGELWVCESESGYAAAMIVSHECNAGYKSIQWSIEAEEAEVTVLHALCVLPELQGKGIAGAMVRKLLEIAESTGQKAVRLDVLGGNLPAEQLYRKYGFQYVDTVQMFYEDTGWTDFKLYEYNLHQKP